MRTWLQIQLAPMEKITEQIVYVAAFSTILEYLYFIQVLL